MVRILGLVLAVALVLVVGGESRGPRGPLTKAEYIAGVNAAGEQDEDDVDYLFEDVVNRDILFCRVCSPDRHTAHGSRWLRSEKRLRADLDEFTDRADALQPPTSVVQLHRRYLSALRGCADGLRRLERRYSMLHSSAVVEADRARRREQSDRGNMRILAGPDVFEREVAIAVGHACNEPLANVFSDFEDRGYEFGED